MTTEALKDKLKELHAAMDGAHGADAELTELLHVLDADIRSLLGKGVPKQAGDQQLTTRSQNISARFAAKHPRLEPVLRELTDMLASLGI